jgi:hypothetical protein
MRFYFALGQDNGPKVPLVRRHLIGGALVRWPPD